MKTEPFAIDFLTAAISKPGSRYDHNEDAYRLDEKRGLFLIADGMGGHQAGEIASRIAIETLYRHLSRASPERAEEAIGDGLIETHQEIRRAADSDLRYRGMGTTALVCWILLQEGVLWVGHVGNSRAYLFRTEQLQRLTEDHTLLNEIRRAGMLPPSNAQLPPPGVLSQALGHGSLLAPQIICHDVQSGDQILLCTDGVSDVLSDEEIARLLQRGNHLYETCEQIAQAVEERGAPDNFTIILIEVLRTAASHQTLAKQKEVLL